MSTFYIGLPTNCNRTTERENDIGKVKEDKGTVMEEIPDELIEGVTKIANKLTREHTVWGIVEEWQTRKVIEAMMMLKYKIDEAMICGKT